MKIFFTSSARIVPAQFDERFVECFTAFVFDHLFLSEDYIKKSLLTAALRGSSDGGAPEPSLVARSMQMGFSMDEISGYHEDGAALELYLKNIDKIGQSLLRRNGEETEDVADKASYEKAVNESIATLRNVRDGSPKISLGKVLYGVDGEGISKMIETDSSGYYEGSVVISGSSPIGALYEKNGKGVLILKNGSKYEGDFANDKRTGKGVLIWADGDKYEGDFDDNKLTGRGVITWADGDKYEGDFVNDKRTGKGVLTLTDGNKYEGDFVDDKRTGRGIFIWADGNKYEGDFVDGKRTGRGVFTWASGNKYSGTYVGNQPMAGGTLELITDYRDGDTHPGKNFTGKGSYTWANGNRYEGGFVNGRIAGEGVFASTAFLHEGRFADGKGVIDRITRKNVTMVGLPSATFSPQISLSQIPRDPINR